MNNPIKKLFALMTVMVLAVSMLNACGGSGSSGEGESKAAEPNAGVRGVVVTLPDGWTVTSGNDDGYLVFSSEDSDYNLGLYSTNSADLEEMKKYNDGITTTDVKEYYDKTVESYEQNAKKGELEASDMKICGTDGRCYKEKAGDGNTGMTAVWLLDDNTYMITMFNGDNYDMETGKIKEDPELLSEDEVAVFEAVTASAQAGDGAALQKSLAVVNTVGDYSFETPEGYRVESFDKYFVNLVKDGSEAGISVSVTTEDDMNYIEHEGGEKPESLEDEWSYRTQNLADEDKMEIAGAEGVMHNHPDENGKTYTITAEFFGDEGIYNLSMDTMPWDENGNIKADAVELTQDDIAVFESFVKSFKEK